MTWVFPVYRQFLHCWSSIIECGILYLYGTSWRACSSDSANYHTAAHLYNTVHQPVWRVLYAVFESRDVLGVPETVLPVEGSMLFVACVRILTLQTALSGLGRAGCVYVNLASGCQKIASDNSEYLYTVVYCTLLLTMSFWDYPLQNSSIFT